MGKVMDSELKVHGIKGLGWSMLLCCRSPLRGTIKFPSMTLLSKLQTSFSGREIRTQSDIKQSSSWYSKVSKSLSFENGPRTITYHVLLKIYHRDYTQSILDL